MKARNLPGTGIALISLGPGILVVAELFSKWHPDHKALWDSAILIGIVLFGAGILILGIWVVAMALPPLQEGLGRIVFPGGDAPHNRVSASAADLTLLHDIYSDYFGDEIPSAQLMRRWMERCSTAFQLVYRETMDRDMRATRRLVGSYKMLPLTAAGVTALREGQACGSSLSRDHIWSSSRPASCYYIGDVFATDRVARAVVLHELLKSCTEFTNRPITFYARPLTRDGRRVMKRRGFVQAVDGMSDPEIGKLCMLQIAS